MLGRKVFSKKDGLVHLTKGNFSLIYHTYLEYLFFLKKKDITKVSRYTRIFVSRLFVLWTKIGNERFVKYLKAALYSVNSFLGGNPLKCTAQHGIKVKLVNGLPWIIPSVFRRELRANNMNYIHIVNSVLYSYKGLGMEYGSIDISSITAEPVNGLEDTTLFQEFSVFLQSWIPSLTKGLPQLDSYSTNEPTIFSSGPMGSLSSSFRTLDLFNLRNFYPDIVSAMEIYSRHSGHWRFGTVFTNVLTIVTHRDTMANSLKKEILHAGLPGEITSYEALRNQSCIGRLCTKYEAAGKIRIFAIGDWWTQWLFKPLHSYIFDILKNIKSDATFDQNGALDSFVRMNYGARFWSFDLKSATDMIPKQLYFPLLSILINEQAAKAWSQIMDRPFKAPKEILERDNSYGDVHYTRGQPMGFLSSWGLLALLHHALVAFSYYRIHQSSVPSSFYRVLGDDIVISDRDLANSYLEVCKGFEIPLSLYKSYADATVLNFASRTISNRGEDFTPLSLKEILQARSLDRKAEFAYRLQTLGYIPKGINNLFRVFFVAGTWKQESQQLMKGTFSSYGRRAYRVLLQPNGYNGLTLSSLILSFMPSLSLSSVPVASESLTTKALSGFEDLKDADVGMRLIKFSIYFVDKYLTQKLIDFRLKALKLSRLPHTVVPGYKRSYTYQDMLLRRFNNHIPQSMGIYHSHEKDLAMLASRIGLETARLGYDEEGKFDTSLYITELFEFVAKLPTLFNMYSEEEMMAQVKRHRIEERLVSFGELTLYERVLRRRLIQELVVPLSKVLPVPRMNQLGIRRKRSGKSFQHKTSRSASPRIGK